MRSQSGRLVEGLTLEPCARSARLAVGAMDDEIQDRRRRQRSRYRSRARATTLLLLGRAAVKSIGAPPSRGSGAQRLNACFAAGSRLRFHAMRLYAQTSFTTRKR